MKRMEDRELAETTGGVAWWISLVVGGLIISVFKDWGEFKEGLAEGWKAYDTR